MRQYSLLTAALLSALALSSPVSAAGPTLPTTWIIQKTGACDVPNYQLAIRIQYSTSYAAHFLYVVNQSGQILAQTHQTASSSSSAGNVMWRVSDLDQWAGNLRFVFHDPSVDTNSYTSQLPPFVEGAGLYTLNTFKLTDSNPNCRTEDEDAGASVENFLGLRASLFANSSRPTHQRLARLNGQSHSTGLSGGELLSYVSAFAASGQLPISASLSAISALDQSSHRDDMPFDAWIEGTFSLIETQPGTGRASTAAIGADYQFSRDLLVGGFISIDRVDGIEHGANTFSGLGWMAGPYATARITDNLYLDLTAGLGTATNKAQNTAGDVEFGSTRAYFNASLLGEFGEEGIRFSPRLGLTYTGEWAAGYTDQNGVWTDATSSTSSSVFAGPGVTFTDNASDITRSLTLRADANTTLDATSVLSGALEASANLVFDSGLDLSARTKWSGIGTSAKTLSVSVKASAGF